MLSKPSNILALVASSYLNAGVLLHQLVHARLVQVQQPIHDNTITTYL
jgi:hypothetical protein